MFDLDLLSYRDRLKTRKSDKLVEVYDIIRRKWLQLTPEEMVRQLALLHLIEIGYSERLIQVEKAIKCNGLIRRFDLIAYVSAARPNILVECKAPAIPIDQKAFDQIAQYNMTLKTPHLWVTNGRSNYCCRINFEEKSYVFLNELPGNVSRRNERK